MQRLSSARDLQGGSERDKQHPEVCPKTLDPSGHRQPWQYKHLPECESLGSAQAIGLDLNNLKQPDKPQKQYIHEQHWWKNPDRKQAYRVPP